MSELKIQKVGQNLYDLLSCWYSEYYEGEEDEDLYKELEKSVDIAVEALDMIEQEPCKDCISREYMYKLGAKCIAARNENDELVAIASIESLPSVQQKTDLDKIRSEIKAIPTAIRGEDHMTYIFVTDFKKQVLHIIDKYREV